MTISNENLNYYRQIHAENIPSGLTFPFEMIMRYAHELEWGPTGLMKGRGEVLDIAGGAGKNTIELKKRRFTPVLIDINEYAVDMLKMRDFFAYVSNVLKFGDNLSGTEMVYLEHFPLTLINAVFSSVPFKELLKVADAYTAPGGKILIADFVAADIGHAELRSRLDWGRKKWERRYRDNSRAFQDLDMTYRTFLVVKPSEKKAEYEWKDDPGILREIWERRDEKLGSNPLSGIFERFASHPDPQAILKFVRQDLEYRVLEKNMGIVSSRDSRGGGSPVIYTVLQKPGDVYRFHPWMHGLKIKDSDFRSKWKARKHKYAFPLEITKYYQLLIQNMKARGLNTQAFDEMLALFIHQDRQRLRRMALHENL